MGPAAGKAVRVVAAAAGAGLPSRGGWLSLARLEGVRRRQHLRQWRCPEGVFSTFATFVCFQRMLSVVSGR
jgi:hypothetical protein